MITRYSFLAGSMLAASLMGAATAALAGSPDAVLTGVVKSAEEGPMEGVVVSARRDGATYTISVVSDERGRYRFPAGRLEAGHYSLAIRAVGYDLRAPSDATLTPGKSAAADLDLIKTKALGAQLSGAEWLLSVPGTEDQKGLLNMCQECHTLERVLESTHDAAELKPLMLRMGNYAYNSWPLHPQLRKVPVTLEHTMFGLSPALATAPAWLASINLSTTSDWQYSLKKLPRLTGKSTRVIVTEYDLARDDIEPHDVIVDKSGIVWFSEFDTQFLGRLDPKTGEMKEFPIPVNRPGYPEGELDIEFDMDQNIWLSLMFQGGVAKFDKKTGTFRVFHIPENLLSDNTQQSMVASQNWEVDGKVWMSDVGIRGLRRVDVKTNHWVTWQPFENLTGLHANYGACTDAKNNLWFMDFAGAMIGRIDAQSYEVKLFATPTPHSAPRRGRVDAHDRLWFAEWAANRVAMFDTRTLKFKEWQLPTPWMAPYDAVADKNGDVWTGGMSADRVARLNPATAEIVEYQLPRETNIRRVFVDNAPRSPVLWVGNNHHSSIVKLETLD